MNYGMALLKGQSNLNLVKHPLSTYYTVVAILGAIDYASLKR